MCIIKQYYISVLHQLVLGLLGLEEGDHLVDGGDDLFRSSVSSAGSLSLLAVRLCRWRVSCRVGGLLGAARRLAPRASRLAPRASRLAPRAGSLRTRRAAR